MQLAIPFNSPPTLPTLFRSSIRTCTHRRAFPWQPLRMHPGVLIHPAARSSRHRSSSRKWQPRLRLITQPLQCPQFHWAPSTDTLPKKKTWVRLAATTRVSRKLNYSRCQMLYCHITSISKERVSLSLKPATVVRATLAKRCASSFCFFYRRVSLFVARFPSKTAMQHLSCIANKLGKRIVRGHQ